MEIDSRELQQANDQLQHSFAIDYLVAEYQESVESMIRSCEKYKDMQSMLLEFNPRYQPLELVGSSRRAEVLANVVAGIYVPLIHGFTAAMIKNIACGVLPPTVIAPPRDAIPLAISLQEQANIQRVQIDIVKPPINRNIAGVCNNQKDQQIPRSPYLELLIDQLYANMNGSNGILEIETGIYGTTSLVMVEEFKKRGIRVYVPIKVYGLGPNISYTHAVLSDGNEWIAEVAEKDGLDGFQGLIGYMMTVLDTMEELGMERHYKSVEELYVDSSGMVCPVIVATTSEEVEVAVVTNTVVKDTAAAYADITSAEIRNLLEKVPWLIEQSKKGFPFTLTEPIPPMDSKEAHYAQIRASELFDYPSLIL